MQHWTLFIAPATLDFVRQVDLWFYAVNANECIMTRIQEMSLNYHFKMEQQSGSSTMAFFGFNGEFCFCSCGRRRVTSDSHDLLISFALGTAGVWRIQAINEAEGWKERTTVEDMDLAVRASLQGWKFVYLGDLKVCVYVFLAAFKNEKSHSELDFKRMNWQCTQNAQSYWFRIWHNIIG